MYKFNELLDYCKEHKIRTPVAELIKYGNKCGWKKKNRKPFQSLGTFVNHYNSVLIKENGDSNRGYWGRKWKKSKFKEKIKKVSKETRFWKKEYYYKLEENN